MQHHSLLRWRFSVLYRTTFSLPFPSPSPSLFFTSKHNRTQTQTLPLAASGFKARLWWIHCDSTGFRAVTGSRRGRWQWGSEKVVWRRRRMNQREENNIRWRWNQHHRVCSWHNWLYHRQFCKLLTPFLWGNSAVMSCRIEWLRVHVCTRLCTDYLYICMRHS